MTLDRLGSIGKYFPYGQERPSATTDGKEKFATYFRDSETGLDYANNRYHQPGMGRFMTPDPSHAADPKSPNSWNQYAYAGGDPANNIDPNGLEWCGPNGTIWCDGITVYANCDQFCFNADWNRMARFQPSDAYSAYIACIGLSGNFDACGSDPQAVLNPAPACPAGMQMFDYGCDTPLSWQARQIFSDINMMNPSGFINAFAAVMAGDAAGTIILAQAITFGAATANGTLTGTVWDSIVATQDAYTGTVLPRSLTMSAGGSSFWIAPNATEHIYEWAAGNLARGVSQNLVNVGTQQLLTSLQAAIAQAVAKGITYGQSMTVGGWELTFGAPGADGLLPELYHALPVY